METTESLRGRLNSARELQSVVRTMKGMAAVNIRQYQRSVESLVEYTRAVGLGFQALARRCPQCLDASADTSGVAMAVVFGSDQGMCGPLNREIAAHALEHLDKVEPDRNRRLVAAVGVRVTGELEGAGQPVQTTFPLPSAVTGLVTGVDDLLVAIEEWRSEQPVHQVTLFHQEPRMGASYEPRTVSLLPLDTDWLRSLAAEPWPTRMLPTFTTDWQTLFAALVREHLFGALFRALAESLASENAARLAAMQAAENNIEEKIEQLQAAFHRTRQAAITEELLDVIAGFEVLKQDGAR